MIAKVPVSYPRSATRDDRQPYRIGSSAGGRHGLRREVIANGEAELRQRTLDAPSAQAPRDRLDQPPKHSRESPAQPDCLELHVDPARPLDERVSVLIRHR
jgi:hypothetical protein